MPTKLQCVAIYCRVSTRGQNLAGQKAELEKWAAVHTDRPVRWYIDRASGSTMDRPHWQRLQRDLEAGHVAQIVVWRLDRLGRTARGLTSLFADLRARKVNLVSLRDSLDLSTPGGRLVATVMAGVAEYEREVIGERIAVGQQAARAAGKRWGGSRKGRRLSITTEQADQVRRLHTEGTPIAKIARATKVSRRSVYRILRDAA